MLMSTSVELLMWI